MKMMLRGLPFLTALVMAFGLAACEGEQEAGMSGGAAVQMAQIEGSVVYRERMLLPPGVEVEVQLEDVSRPDAMATVLTSVRWTPEGSVPYPFVLEYDPADIDPRRTYALRATIKEGDRLLFTTTDYIAPFTGNPVEILVSQVPSVSHPEGTPLEGTVWILETLAGEPAPVGAGGKPVDIQFTPEGQVAAGFSGCNRYSGGYKRDGAAQHGSPLKLGPVAGTMMACTDGDELERGYLQMLEQVTAFRLEGNTLWLLAGPEVLATFRSS